MEERDHFVYVRLWLSTVAVLTCIFSACVLYQGAGFDVIYMSIFFGAVALAGSLPALVVYRYIFPWIENRQGTGLQKKIMLLYFNLGIVVLYCLPAYSWLSSSYDSFLDTALISFFPLLVSSCIAMALNWNRLSRNYFTSASRQPVHLSQHQNTYNMEHTEISHQQVSENTQFMQKPLTKGIVTGILILVMLIPTFFISNLVRERRARQQEVVKDVTDKWAGEQNITGPYLYIPYYHHEKLGDGKTATSTRQLIVLPEELSVSGDIFPEERKRSIYKVLLYRSTLNAKGHFRFSVPKDIPSTDILFNEIKLCMGISDFKGIEKQVSGFVNGKKYELNPGLPTASIDKSGLAAAIEITPAMLDSPIRFEMPLQIIGSRQLHFVPLSGSSRFTLNSAWPSPSFDGTSLPTVREVSDKGFTATWSFNKANLPFNTVLVNSGIETSPLSFGVSMLQPADQYAKTERSIKYALLIIGLSFSLFFIVELMQQKPLHPVQYVLMGLALVIFYTLLLSVSEFIPFDSAYLVAALATVVLITLYTKSHFRVWKTALVFGATLSGLYGFIFVLIRLEDTALLLGSIGLFLILCSVMYASRKINWYPAAQPAV